MHVSEESRSIAGADRFETLWRAAPDRTVYSSPRYLQAAAQAFGRRTELHITNDESAAAYVFVRGRGPLRRVVTVPFMQYSAVLLRTRQDASQIHARNCPLEQVLGAIERSSKRARLLVRLKDPRPAQWRGWQVSPLFTYALDCGAGSDAWSKSAQRLHDRNQTRFQMRESPESASSVIDLCAQAYARRQRPLPASTDQVLDLVSGMGSWSRTFVASREGRIEAGVIVFHDGRTAHYSIAGSQPGPAMTVLLGHIFQVLHADGIRRFDFVGANTASIAEFKRRFGGELEMYFQLTWRCGL